MMLHLSSSPPSSLLRSLCRVLPTSTRDSHSFSFSPKSPENSTVSVPCTMDFISTGSTREPMESFLISDGTATPYEKFTRASRANPRAGIATRTPPIDVLDVPEDYFFVSTLNHVSGGGPGQSIRDRTRKFRIYFNILKLEGRKDGASLVLVAATLGDFCRSLLTSWNPQVSSRKHRVAWPPRSHGNVNWFPTTDGNSWSSGLEGTVGSRVCTELYLVSCEQMCNSGVLCSNTFYS